MKKLDDIAHADIDPVSFVVSALQDSGICQVTSQENIFSSFSNNHKY